MEPRSKTRIVKNDSLTEEGAAGKASAAAFEWVAAHGVLCWSGNSRSVLGVPDGGEPKTLEEYLSLICQDDREDLRRRLETADLGPAFDVVHSIEARYGQPRRIRCLGVIQRDDSGKASHIQCAVEDSTAREKELERLRTAEAQLRLLSEASADSGGPREPHEAQTALIRAVIQNAREMFTLMRRDGSILYESPSFRTVLGRDPSSAVGKSAFDFIHPSDVTLIQRATSRLYEAPESSSTIEVRALHVDGSIRTLETVIRVLPEESGIDAVLMSCRDVTERKKAERQRGLHEADLIHQACHDSLTGLANRKLFLERLGDCLSRASCGEVRFAVIYLDVDRFKQINDTLGHQEADHVLQAFVARVQEHLRRDDLLARLGGDEFAVVLDGFAEQSDVIAIARRIQEAGFLPLNLPSGRVVLCTASMGVVFGDDRIGAIADVIKCADAAMYHAKLNGRARLEIFDAAMFEERAFRLDLLKALPAAIERRELGLEYQPCVSLKTGEVTRCEALLRWRFGGREMVPPDRVIQIAEESGVGDHVALASFEQACRQVGLWDEKGVAIPRVSINVSAGNLISPGLAKRIPEVFANCGVSPGRIEIEINEAALCDLNQAARRRMFELRDLGVGIAIDNFGKGYSSLNYLKNFPAQTVKIDRMLVAELPTEKRSAAIVRAIVVLSESIGLRVIGEGVETEEQLTALRREGCDEAQGFLFSRPCHPDQLDGVLRRWRAQGSEPRGGS